MFRNQSAIFRRSTNTKTTCVCSPPEDGYPVPKHVGVILIMIVFYGV
jgi:hypothetical protein